MRTALVTDVDVLNAIHAEADRRGVNAQDAVNAQTIETQRQIERELTLERQATLPPTSPCSRSRVGAALLPRCSAPAG